MNLDNPFVENMKLNSLINKHLWAVRSKRVKPNTKGAHSYCYFFGNYVILRNIAKYDNSQSLTEHEEVFTKRKEFINKIKHDFKVNTPELCCCYKGKHHFYEIQERAKGTILSVYYPSTAKLITYNSDNVLDGTSSTEDLLKEEKIQPYEAEQVGQAIYLYNVKMQKQLKNADQRVFDRFVRDFKVLMQNGVSIDVTRSENFLFDKNEGFSFVDLELQQQGCSVPDDFQICLNIYSAFADFKTFCQYMKPKQIDTILKNADAVKLKVYNAIKNNNFNLTEQQKDYLFKKTKTANEDYEKLTNIKKKERK